MFYGKGADKALKCFEGMYCRSTRPHFEVKVADCLASLSNVPRA